MTIRTSLILTLTLSSAAVFADLQYEQTTRASGGSLVNMPIIGSRLKEPHTTSNYIKGNKMAMVSKDQTTIYDLDAGNVTTINPGKKTYSVMTFEEMRAAMEESMKKMRDMQQQSKNQEGTMNWSVKVKDAGDEKNINGWDAHHFVITLGADATDTKSSQNAGMKMSIDSWNAKDLPGTKEQRAFFRKFSEKIGAGFATGINPFVRAQMGSGWEAAAKEMAKMEGFAVTSIMKMSATANGQEVMVPESEQNRKGPSVGEMAKDSVAGAMLGRLGGFGGGKKKKSDDPPPAGNPNQKMVPATLMEMTTELVTYTTNPVDSSVFVIPAGFKQVEADMKRVR